MSQISILFRRDRVWLTALVSVLLATVVVALLLQSTRTYNANAFTTAEATNTGAPTATVGPSDEDVPVMNVLLPAAATDTLVHNGAGASAAGNAFTAFDATEMFSDDDHDDATDYVDGALVVNSADAIVAVGEVVTAGTADLTSFDLAEPGLEVFADTQTDNNTLDANEDIYRQVYNGADVFANDGSSLLEDFPDAVKFMDDAATNNNSLDSVEAIVADADANNTPSTGDSVTVAGKANVRQIEAADTIILDDANNDGDYDPGEVIWKDTTASVLQFNAGSDYVLVGASVPPSCSGVDDAKCKTVHSLVNESGLAYLDFNNDGSLTSTRNTESDTVVWFGNAVNPADGDNLATSVTFFSAAQFDGADDVNGTWLEDMNAFEPVFYYVVSSPDAGYSAADDIFRRYHDGSQASGDGSELRTIGANDKYSDTNNNSAYDDGELIANSVDANLAGAEIVVSGTVDLTAFGSATFPFFNYVDDGDSAYEDGEDIYKDDDKSGYVDADQLTGISVANTGTATDADISELSVWIDDGDNTFEADQDTHALTDADGTYFASRETFTGTVFTAAQRIFVTVNIAASPTNARTIIAQLADNSGGDGNCDNSSADEDACAVLFISKDDGPHDGNITNANTITIDALAALPFNIGTIISTDANADGIAAIGDRVTVIWRGDLDGFTDIASASLSLAEFGQGSSYTMAEDDGAGNDCVDNDAPNANVFCYTFELGAGSVDATGRNAFVTSTDDVGNVSSAVEDDADISVDVQAPTVTDGAIAISGATGTGGAYKYNDTVSAAWNNVTDGNLDETSVSITFSQFGGGPVAASQDADVWTAIYSNTAGGIDAANRNVSVTVTDDAGNTTTTADTTNATVDNVQPTVTNGAISISGATGTGGAYKYGDTVTATWSNVTDGNADETGVTVNFSAMGGGAAVAASESTNVWNATYAASSGTGVDGTNLNVSVTVTDDAGNAVTTADTTNATFDNVYPTVTAGAITVSGATGTGGAYKIGDTVMTVWDNDVDANADETTVQMDYGPFNGGTTVAASEASNDWTSSYTIAAGSVDDANNAVAVTVIDDAGNVATTFDNVLATVDNIRPTFSTVAIYDSGATKDGLIDRIAIVYSEAIAVAAAGANGFDVTGSNFGTCSGESVTPDGSDTNYLNVTCTTAYTAVGNMSIAFTGNSGIVDDAGNQVSSVTMTSAVGAGPAIGDSAQPVIMTVSPASAGTNVLTDANVVITFSEPMNTTFAEGTEFTATPDATSWTSAASVSNTVITLDHSNDFNCNTTYTVTLDAPQITDAVGSQALSLAGPVDGVWSFATRSCSTGGGGGGSSSSTVTSTTPIVTLTGPDDGDSLDGGEEAEVTWTTSGSGHDTVSIAYSTNAGLTYSQVAYNIDEDDGVYTWNVPDIDASDAILKITAYDSGKGTLDTDTVTFDIVASETATEDTEPETTTVGAEWDSGEDRYVAPGSGEYGDSPLDGSEEEISEVASGWFVRSPGYSSVYYVDENYERNVFWDTNTFFTWADSWDDVVWVTNATLPTLTLGSAMLPQPGVVLVKIQSDPKVYAIDVDSDGTYVLRWIPTEEVAVALYGADWADYVIDLDSTVFSKFGTGDDMTEDDHVDTGVMKTRMELWELAQ